MKVLILDDEPLSAKDLAFMIEKYCHEVTSIEICLSPAKAMTILEEKQFDLLFLDIEMPEMTGFDFLKTAKLPKQTKLIITTAYEQYAIKAFNADAVHYLVKPVKEEDLVKAVRKAVKETPPKSLAKEGHLVVSIFDGDMHHIIKQEEIIRLEADGNYTNIHLSNNRKVLSSKNLSSFEKALSSDLFFRPHRSHIIKLDQVSQISKGAASIIVLSNGDRIPLSKSRHKDFEQALGI